MKSKRLNFFFIASLIIGLYACAEKQEGCLDVYATNFAFEADIACADCCTYPVFELTVSHYWDSLEAFRYADPIFEQQDSTDTLWINQLGFFVSDIRLHTDTDSLGMFTLVEVPNTFGDILFLESSIDWIDQKDLSGKDLGIVLQAGETIDSVSFWLGFDPLYGVPDPIGLDVSNPVAIQSDSSNWSDDSGLLYSHFNYKITGSLQKDSTRVELINPFYFKLPLESPVTLETGGDVSLNLRLFYSELLEGCSLLSANNEQLRLCLEQNFSNSFKIFSLQ